MSNNFRNIHKVKQEEFKDFQVLLCKFKDIEGLSSFGRTLIYKQTFDVPSQGLLSSLPTLASK